MECPKCQGERFKEDILKITFNDLNISQMSKMSIKNAKGFFANLINNLDAKTLNKSEQIIKQLLHKFEILENIGLAYLAIDRATSSLSGGEAQRLRIATQLVSNLCGLTYVLDEPSVGLHSSDTEKLMNTIQQLKDNGNTIILVEHDPDIIKKADHIIDMGPKAGEFGGQIIAKGSLAKIMKNPNSITGQSLRKNEAEYIYKSEEKEKIFSTGLRIKGAHANNLKNIDLEIPKGRLISMTGVSGSGKTSLAFDVIAASYNAGRAINCKEISILNFESLTMINQEKIGVSPLSTSATYTGVFDHIRDLFAKLDESKKQSFKKSHFSFNSKDGSCPECKGMGQVKVSMDFLSDVWTTCDQCHGKRYQDKVLEIKHKGHSIFDVLNLSIHHALDLFEQEIKIKKVLEILDELGLGYIKLGQATSSLSGGETQRLKLAHKLLDSHQQNALFIFDEPTTGLHMQDIEVLLKVFAKLIDKGNTVLAIEHNLDIIKASDWIIDLGPNGGDEGGEVLYSGSVAGLKGNMKSQTAAYL